MEKIRIVEMVHSELNRAELLHQDYPDNIFEAIAIITEELGELSQAALDHKYKGDDFQNIIDEGVQVAAMGLRFLFNVSRFKEVDNAITNRKKGV